MNEMAWLGDLDKICHLFTKGTIPWFVGPNIVYNRVLTHYIFFSLSALLPLRIHASAASKEGWFCISSVCNEGIYRVCSVHKVSKREQVCFPQTKNDHLFERFPIQISRFLWGYVMRTIPLFLFSSQVRTDGRSHPGPIVGETGGDGHLLRTAPH